MQLGAQGRSSDDSNVAMFGVVAVQPVIAATLSCITPL